MFYYVTWLPVLSARSGLLFLLPTVGLLLVSWGWDLDHCFTPEGDSAVLNLAVSCMTSVLYPHLSLGPRQGNAWQKSNVRACIRVRPPCPHLAECGCIIFMQNVGSFTQRYPDNNFKVYLDMCDFGNAAPLGSYTQACPVRPALRSSLWDRSIDSATSAFRVSLSVSSYGCTNVWGGGGRSEEQSYDLAYAG